MTTYTIKANHEDKTYEILDESGDVIDSYSDKQDAKDALATYRAEAKEEAAQEAAEELKASLVDLLDSLDLTDASDRAALRKMAARIKTPAKAGV